MIKIRNNYELIWYSKKIKILEIVYENKTISVHVFKSQQDSVDNKPKVETTGY